MAKVLNAKLLREKKKKSDDLGLRSPVVLKTFHSEALLLSIVARLLNGVFAFCSTPCFFQKPLLVPFFFHAFHVLHNHEHPAAWRRGCALSCCAGAESALYIPAQ